MVEDKKAPEIRFDGFTESWGIRKITDVAKVFIGLVTTMTSNYRSEGVLLIRNSDIKEGYFDFDDYPIHLDEDFAEDNATRKLKVHDIVTVHTGDVGTSAVVGERENGAIGFATINTRPDTELIESNFLVTFFNTEKHKKWAIQMSTGDGRNNYNLYDFTKIHVPVPELDEQTAIGNFFRTLDNTISSKKQQHEKTVNIKKAMLEKMFPKNGSDVPEIRFNDFNGAWEKQRLGDIGRTFTGLSGKTKDDFGHGDAKYITYMNVFSNPIADINNTGKIEIDNKQNNIQYGDILFTTSSEIPEEVGMSSVWLENISNVYLNSFCFGYRLKEKIDLYYLAFGLRSPYVREQFILLAQGSTRFNISKNEAMEIFIPTPHITEQTAIGNFFRNLDTLIEAQREELEKLQNIKKACLNKMFV